MKKIPMLFKYDKDFNVTKEVNPDCQWVFDGYGKATRKWDGTACLIKDGKLYKRRTIKAEDINDQKYINLVLAQWWQVDRLDGKFYGWMPIENNDKWHHEAYDPSLPDGTYELIGPKIQGNAEYSGKHLLVSHLNTVYCNVARTWDGLIKFFDGYDIEGLVFYHPDGRMAKIRKHDLGLRRKK